MNWNQAYNNTKTIVSHCEYNGISSYNKGCSNCNSSDYERSTNEHQLIGNCYQRIVVCKCGSPFVEEWKQ